MIRNPIGALIQFILIIIWLGLIWFYIKTERTEFHTLAMKQERLFKINKLMFAVSLIIIWV